MNIKPLTDAQERVLSKDVLGMLINLVAGHENQNPKDETATHLHMLLSQAWDDGDWHKDSPARKDWGI